MKSMRDYKNGDQITLIVHVDNEKPNYGSSQDDGRRYDCRVILKNATTKSPGFSKFPSTFTEAELDSGTYRQAPVKFAIGDRVYIDGNDAKPGTILAMAGDYVWVIRDNGTWDDASPLTYHKKILQKIS